jgi:FkbM family methyltransferase
MGVFMKKSARGVLLWWCMVSMHAYAEEPVAYTIVQGRKPVVVDPVSETIGHTWSRKSGVWEQHLIQKFYELLPSDEPFIAFDLGAQTGAFSLMAAYFPRSQWYAFEPLAEAAEQLARNCALNGIQNVMITQGAVADYTGVTTISMPDRANWGLSTIGATPLRFRPVSTREVPVITLDEFVEQHNIPRVHFMKLDTEGSEYYILRGAQKMIARDHPIIIMEYNETNMRQCGVCKEDLHALLSSLGYTWQLVSTEDILCIPCRSI